MMPIIVYSMLKFIQQLKFPLQKWHITVKSGIKKPLFGVCLIIIVFSGCFFYISGRNFHSITYGEYYASAFLAQNSPQNFNQIYSSYRPQSVPAIVIATINNASVGDVAIVSVERREILETYYYYCSNMTTINQTIDSLVNSMNIVYDNPDDTLFISRQKPNS